MWLEEYRPQNNGEDERLGEVASKVLNPLGILGILVIVIEGKFIIGTGTIIKGDAERDADGRRPIIDLTVRLRMVLGRIEVIINPVPHHCYQNRKKLLAKQQLSLEAEVQSCRILLPLVV